MTRKGSTKRHNRRPAPHPVAAKAPRPVAAPPATVAVAPVAPGPVMREMAALMGRYAGPTDHDGQWLFAGRLAGSTAIPLHLQRSQANCFAMVLAAQELDIGVITAYNNLFTDADGQRGMKGALMQALIIRAGHQLDVLAHTDQLCHIQLTRCDGRPGGTAEWSVLDAQRNSQVAGSWWWTTYPKDMLFWRAIARAARYYASDVLCGFGYLPEELKERAHRADVADGPVDMDVQEYLATLADQPYDALLKGWAKAREAMTGRYAGNVDGVAFTVDQTVAMMLERARPSEPAAAEPDPVAVAPAGQGTLGCGCDANTVVMTGQHRDGCATAALDAAWNKVAAGVPA